MGVLGGSLLFDLEEDNEHQVQNSHRCVLPIINLTSFFINVFLHFNEAKNYRQGIYLKNLSLEVAKVFLSVLETIWILEIKSISYNLKLSISDGMKAGPNGSLGPTVTIKPPSPNAETNGIILLRIK